MQDKDLMRAEIYRGRQHRLVFESLKKQGLIVSEIMRKTNKKIEETNEGGKLLTLRETSRALKWLDEKEYAKCLNPSSKQGVKGIVYKISEKGKRVRKII